MKEAGSRSCLRVYRRHWEGNSLQWKPCVRFALLESTMPQVYGLQLLSLVVPGFNEINPLTIEPGEQRELFGGSGG